MRRYATMTDVTGAPTSQERELREHEAPQGEVHRLICLDWHCDVFGLEVVLEIETRAGVRIVCPNKRARCPLP